MQKNKLIQVVKTLSAEEMRWLSKFVVSPYYNSNQYVIRLFEYLKKLHPAFSEKKLKEELVFVEIFGNEEFDIKRLRVVGNRLLTVVERFMVAEKWKKNEFEYKKTLALEYGSRHLYTSFEKRIIQLDEGLRKEEIRDQNYFKTRAELSRKLFDYAVLSQQNSKLKGYAKAAIENFEQYYALRKIQFDLELKDGAKILSADILKATSAKSLQNNYPAFLLYEKLNKLQDEADNRNIFEDCLNLLLQNLGKLGKEDKKTATLLLLNNSNRRSSRPNSNYLKDSLSLYKTGLAEKFFIEKGKFPEATFSNIVTLGAKNKEFSWTQQFINSTGKMLRKEIKDEAIILSKATIAFQKEAYNDAISLLNMHSSSRPLMKSRAKLLSFRAYFELFIQDEDYLDLVLSQIGAHEKFYRRNRYLSKIKIRSNLNSLTFSKQLALARFDTKTLKGIKEKILRETNVTSKQWLIEKVEQLIETG